jgi:hypothetical protein
MKLAQLGFVKTSEEISGKDYFIYPGKAIVGDKKYFATVKDKSGYTYGADTDKANIIKKEFLDKNLVVKPESTVYTDTTNVQSFRGKQQFVRHVVDGNIINKKTTTIKKDTPSITTKPISKEDAKELKSIRHEFAGEKQRGYIPPPPTFWEKAKEEVGSWFKKKSEFKEAKLQKLVQTGKLKRIKGVLGLNPDARSKAINAKLQTFMKENPKGTVGEFLKTLEKTAKVYTKPIETKTITKKRLLRPDKVTTTEVIKPEVALSMKNTGFNEIRKSQKINLEYASTDTLKTNDPKKYTVTHRYLGTNPLVKSYKYKETVSPGKKLVVGGTYNAEKNMNEITNKGKAPSYLDKAKSFFGF